MTERAHRLGVGADRRALQIAQRAQVTQPLVDHRRRPLPRVGVHVGGECLDCRLPALHGRAGQVPRQLLVGESRQHRREDLFLRPQQHDPVDQMQPRRPWHRPVQPHRSATLRRSQWLRVNPILCESPEEPRVAPAVGHHPTRTHVPPTAIVATIERPNSLVLPARCRTQLRRCAYHREFASDAIGGRRRVRTAVSVKRPVDHRPASDRCGCDGSSNGSSGRRRCPLRGSGGGIGHD